MKCVLVVGVGVASLAEFVRQVRWIAVHGSDDGGECFAGKEDDRIVGHVALNRTTSDEVMALSCEVLRKPALRVEVGSVR